MSLVFLKDPDINTDLYRESSRRAVATDADTVDEATGEHVRAISDAVSRHTMALAERQIRAAFEQSQAEISYLSQRTSEGMETARLRGKRIGRQQGDVVETRRAGDAKPLIRDLADLCGGQHANEQVMRMRGVRRNTYYAYFRDIDAEIGREEAHAVAA